MTNKNFIGGIIGNALSWLGLSIENSSEVADIVTIICGILGLVITIISVIIIPLIKWYKEAKKDGKITTEEIKEATNILQNGVDTIAPQNKKERKGEKKND